MDLQKLRYFLMVADAGHITQAAMDAYITQPALSRIIAQVESEFGAKLFDREGKNLRLNDSGQIVYCHVQHIFHELQEIRTELADLEDGNYGSIRLATSFPSYDEDWIGSCIWRYTTEHPHVQYFQRLLSGAEMRRQLKSRDIDIAISDQRIEDSSIVWHEIFSERLGVILAADHPLAAQGTLSMADLHGIPIYCFTEEKPESTLISRLFEKAGYAPNIVFTGNYQKLIDRSVAMGRGVTFISEGAYRAGQLREEKANLCFRAIQEDYSIRSYGIAYLKDRQLPKVISNFIDLIMQCDVEEHRKHLTLLLMEAQDIK